MSSLLQQTEWVKRSGAWDAYFASIREKKKDKREDGEGIGDKILQFIAEHGWKYPKTPLRVKAQEQLHISAHTFNSVLKKLKDQKLVEEVKVSQDVIINVLDKTEDNGRRESNAHRNLVHLCWEHTRTIAAKFKAKFEYQKEAVLDGKRRCDLLCVLELEGQQRRIAFEAERRSDKNVYANQIRTNILKCQEAGLKHIVIVTPSDRVKKDIERRVSKEFSDIKVVTARTLKKATEDDEPVWA